MLDRRWRSRTAGEIRIGPTVKLAYVDQSRQALNDKNTVWQEISGGLDIIKVGNYETSSRSYVGRFNFKGVAAAADSSAICRAGSATACISPRC